MLLAQIDTCQSQAKAGVVQSSGIVSISSVPFGRYEVKLAADMKGQPATGSNQHLVSFSPQNQTIVSLQYLRNSTPTTNPAAESACLYPTVLCQVRSCWRVSQSLFLASLSGAALCSMVTVTWNMDERDSQPISLFVRSSQGIMSNVVMLDIASTVC